MSDLETTLARISRLPASERDELVRWLEDMLDGIESPGVVGPSEAQLADLERRLAEPEDWASDEEVEAFFARHARPT